MTHVCEISITRQSQFNAADFFSWSVRPLYLYPDECTNAPFGSQITDLNACVLRAVLAAKDQGFEGARVQTYMGKTLDLALVDDGFDIERAGRLVADLSA